MAIQRYSDHFEKFQGSSRGLRSISEASQGVPGEFHAIAPQAVQLLRFF